MSLHIPGNVRGVGCCLTPLTLKPDAEWVSACGVHPRPRGPTDLGCVWSWYQGLSGSNITTFLILKSDFGGTLKTRRQSEISFPYGDRGGFTVQRDTDEKQVDRRAGADGLWEVRWGKPLGEVEGTPCEAVAGAAFELVGWRGRSSAGNGIQAKGPRGFGPACLELDLFEEARMNP